MSLRRSAAILCSGHRCGRSAGGPPAQTSCEGSYPGVHRCLRFRSKGCMLHTSHLRGTWLQGISEVHDPELRMLLQQLDAEHRLHCSAWTFWSVSLDSTLNGLQLRSESERARPLRAPSSSKSCLQQSGQSRPKPTSTPNHNRALPLLKEALGVRGVRWLLSQALLDEEHDQRCPRHHGHGHGVIGRFGRAWA